MSAGEPDETKNARQQAYLKRMEVRSQYFLQGNRTLMLINGGGAVALLAFLQVLWEKQILATAVVHGLIALAVGLAFAAPLNYLNYGALLALEHDNRSKMERFSWAHIGCAATSLASFLAAIALVVIGALSELPAEQADNTIQPSAVSTDD